MLNRFSSRLTPLAQVFLREKLKGACSYRRIAGYFRSSIFEIVHEDLEGISSIQIVCNSELDPHDIKVSRAAREQALKARWNEVSVETESLLYRERYRRLYQLLTRRNVEVRVVPRDVCAFIHGKAGIIDLADGSKTCFMGSINETREVGASTTSCSGRIRLPKASRGSRMNLTICGSAAIHCPW